jgi:hypothetical protein
VVAINGKFADGSNMTAIPNYARCNRGGRSLVWMRSSTTATAGEGDSPIPVALLP